MVHCGFGYAAILTACLMAITGCSQGDPFNSGSNDRKTRIVMNLLSVFYGEYLDSHQGRPPKDNDAFREYLETRTEDLNRYNLQSIDQLMTSPRDGQPLLIVCGKRLAPVDSPGTPWAAYEQQGIDGVKMAVQVRGGVQDLSADEIDRIFAQ